MDKSWGNYSIFYGNAFLGMLLLTHYLVICALSKDLFPIFHVLWFLIGSPILIIIQLVILIVFLAKSKQMPKPQAIGVVLAVAVNTVFYLSYGCGGNVVTA